MKTKSVESEAFEVNLFEDKAIAEFLNAQKKTTDSLIRLTRKGFWNLLRDKTERQILADSEAWRKRLFGIKD